MTSRPPRRTGVPRRDPLGYGRRLLRRDLLVFARVLTRPHRLSAVRAVLDGAKVMRALPRRGLRSVMPGPTADLRIDVNRAEYVAEAVQAGLGVLPFGVTCLRRSVVLLRELDRCGLAGDLHLGVRRGITGIEAHAWIEVAGRVLNDDPEVVSTYSPLGVDAADSLASRFV